MTIPVDINEPITHCGADTSMGKLLREYWMPALPSAAVQADGAPYRLRLLAQNLVVFRDTNGAVGVLDEACPHRGASLVVGRNEECGLRCLYHGWKMDVAGRVVDTPRELDPNYGDRIPASGYPTVERCGIIWTYLGERRPAPDFPDYPFANLPDDQLVCMAVPISCNYLLGLDAVWDPTHVPVLHKSSLNPDARVSATLMNIAPYEDFAVDRQPYGARMAQMVPLDGMQFVRMKEYLFPFLRVNSQTADDDADIVVFGNVPIDDENTMFWFILYNEFHPPTQTGYAVQARGASGVRELTYKAADNWGQQRDEMSWHFTGISLDERVMGVIVEDLVMMESIQPTLDRTRHHLTPGDEMVVKCRAIVRRFLHDYETSGTYPDHGDVAHVQPRSLEIPVGESWRDQYAKSLTPST